MKKQEKGITLIALVITIIVLLILAGVTIALLTNDSSAPKKASEAAEANTIATIKDNVSNELMNAITEYYDNAYRKADTTKSLKDEIKSRLDDQTGLTKTTTLKPLLSGTVSAVKYNDFGTGDTATIVITNSGVKGNVTGTINKNGTVSWSDVKS